MSTKPLTHIRGKNWDCYMSTDRLVDVFAAVFSTAWLLLTFATIQQHPGQIVPLLIGAVAIGCVGIGVIYGHRLNYLRIGDRIEMGVDHRRVGRGPELSDEEKERRR